MHTSQEIHDKLNAWFGPIQSSLTVAAIEDHMHAAVAALKAKFKDSTHTAEEVVAEIEEWFVSHIHNSPVSQNTPVFNHIQDAVAKLKAAFTSAE